MKPRQKLCPICDTPYEPTDEICQNCGFNLAREIFVNESVDLGQKRQNLNSRQPRSNQPHYWLIILVLIVLFGSFSYQTYQSHSTKQPALTIKAKPVVASSSSIQAEPSESISRQLTDSEQAASESESSTAYAESIRAEYAVSPADATKINALATQLSTTQKHILAYMYWLEVSNHSMAEYSTRSNGRSFYAESIGTDRWAIYKQEGAPPLIEVNYQYQDNHYAYLMNHDMGPDSPDTMIELYERYTTTPRYQKVYTELQKEWNPYSD